MDRDEAVTLMEGNRGKAVVTAQICGVGRRRVMLDEDGNLRRSSKNLTTGEYTYKIVDIRDCINFRPLVVSSKEAAIEAFSHQKRIDQHAALLDYMKAVINERLTA